MKRRILLVEDEEILREVVKDYLWNEGYEVLAAVDGKEALALFEQHEVDLMILDIMLPEVDGWSDRGHELSLCNDFITTCG